MTEDHRPDVILLRSADDPDPYVQAFASAGFQAICEPVLTFAFPSTDTLHAHLARRDDYAGLVATSPRVGEALRRAFQKDPELLDDWESAPAFVVGPKTSDALRTVGLEPLGAETGTASALASYITKREPDAPLLFLCGNRRRDDLPNGLQAAGVAFDELVVYETHLRTDLELPEPQGETWLAFFSPSGLEAVRAADVGNVTQYRCAAIGPTTAAALESKGLSVEAIAKEPSPDGLVAAIGGA